MGGNTLAASTTAADYLCETEAASAVAMAFPVIKHHVKTVEVHGV